MRKKKTKQRNTRLEVDESGRVLVNAARFYAYLTVQRFLSVHTRALARNKPSSADPAAGKTSRETFKRFIMLCLENNIIASISLA